jgi:pseudooxynicotine oxidase
MRDVIVVGGGFAGVTAARECALRGRDVLLLEARDRLGGRTWTAQWGDTRIEYGGGWVHWHQPHTWSEITRAGLTVELSDDPDTASWYVGDERRTGTLAERDAIAERGWNRFVDGVDDALPNPHRPLHALDRLVPFDRLSIADRMAQLDLTEEERDVLTAELESLASGRLEDSGAVSVLRWHALSGGSLALTQYTGGRVTLTDGTGALLDAIATGAPLDIRLSSPVASVRATATGVEVTTRDGAVETARAAVVAVPLNVLGSIAFDPPLSAEKQAAIALGQASRGSKVFLRVRGERLAHNAIRPGHPFGYLDSEITHEDGTQTLIGFGHDAAMTDVEDLPAVNRALTELMPGFEAVDATMHDWAADEFSAGTWAIHRPGWYEHHHRHMQVPEGRVVLAGSDLADGWAGFIDGAIESGLRAGRTAAALSAS